MTASVSTYGVRPSTVLPLVASAFSLGGSRLCAPVLLARASPGTPGRSGTGDLGRTPAAGRLFRPPSSRRAPRRGHVAVVLFSSCGGEGPLRTATRGPRLCSLAGPAFAAPPPPRPAPALSVRQRLGGRLKAGPGDHHGGLLGRRRRSRRRRYVGPARGSLYVAPSGRPATAGATPGLLAPLKP